MERNQLAGRKAAIAVALVCAAVATTASMVLAGWLFDIELLRSWGGPVSMNPATALTLVAAATALALRATGGRTRRRIGLLMAAVAITVGGLRTAGYLLGSEIGLDSFLFEERLSAGGTPNRMALNTAIAFVLTGSSLLLLDAETRGKRRPAEPLAASSGLIGLLALAGHAYRAPMLSQVAGYSVPMPVGTAAAFLLLSLGTLAARPGRAWMGVVTGQHAGGAVARRLLPLVTGLPLILGYVAIRDHELQPCAPAFGFAAFALANTIILGAVVLATARWLGRADLALRAARNAEERLRSQLEAVNEAGLAVADAVATAVEPEGGAVLQSIADRARAISDAQYSAVAFGSDPERPFSSYTQSGMTPAEIAAIGAEPHPVGLRGFAARVGGVVRVPNVELHPAFAGLPERHPSITSFLGVSVRHRSRSMGNLFVANKRGGGEFTAEDERAILLFSSHVGVTLENARLYRQAVLDRLRLEAVLEQLPEGVVVRDALGNPILFNRMARSLAGSPETPALEIYRPSGEPIPWEEHPAKRAQGGETVRGVEALLRHDERRVPVLVSAAPTRDESRAVAGTVTVFQDITSLKEIERMREEWSAVIAHDLRQPVGVIMLNATLLERRLQASPELSVERSAVTRIGTAARNLSRMVADLLDMSLLEANRLAIDRQRGDVATLVREVIERSAAAQPKRPVRLEVRGLSTVASFDASRMDQVLGNLLSNAFKYGQEGTEVLAVVAGREADIEVSVTNRGVGVPADELPRLFARFYRARGARRGPGGIGLGLYLCKGLVEAHGGTIRAESVPGESTTFRFTLPRGLDLGGREA